MNKRLKYLGYSVVFQEVPNEVTLAINISGCPYKCVGCHSKYLWEYEGNYIGDDLANLIEKYRGLITCVCFMGGDQNQEELIDLLLYVRQHGFKTALYTGLKTMTYLHNKVLANLDYCKIGNYDFSRGGLNDPNTNQQMFKKNEKTNHWDDITYKFWKEDKIT